MTLADLDASVTGVELAYWRWLYRTEERERKKKRGRHG